MSKRRSFPPKAKHEYRATRSGLTYKIFQFRCSKSAIYNAINICNKGSNYLDRPRSGQPRKEKSPYE